MQSYNKNFHLTYCIVSNSSLPSTAEVVIVSRLCRLQKCLVLNGIVPTETKQFTELFDGFGSFIYRQKKLHVFLTTSSLQLTWSDRLLCFITSLLHIWIFQQKLQKEITSCAPWHASLHVCRVIILSPAGHRQFRRHWRHDSHYF